jgi:coproporphyrinogen III oxidase
MTKEDIGNWFRNLQDNICLELEKADGAGRFHQDIWERAEGGGGRSRVIQGGAVIEKGGVNFSAVFGKAPEFLLQHHKVTDAYFFATGVSIVIHPKNPMVPIIHMNVRYFEMSNGVKWFGGGIDLTPHYILPEDAIHFHTTLKTICDTFDSSYYPEFKKWADDYFFIKHRNETRGVGGIFFDKLSETKSISLQDRFDFVLAIGNSFAPVYTYLMKKNSDLPFGEKELQWQDLRRSRYVEFNLVYDAGTKFGLETNGRIESILMSLPPRTGWVYGIENTMGEKERATQNLLKKGIDWANYVGNPSAS